MLLNVLSYSYKNLSKHLVIDIPQNGPNRIFLTNKPCVSGIYKLLYFFKSYKVRETRG